ncbi:hypothetical protein DPEC_G00028040 [Dallia pectoralis]|uniref:Uncharacterized protein n=1 Tax=Dallia pectoralis TaxID=75939 RepID=A0ACC2HHZ2_DALPE|nr:hypothetical protein DPEC_G00028040 [Dallia pectoralis]
MLQRNNKRYVTVNRTEDRGYGFTIVCPIWMISLRVTRADMHFLPVRDTVLQPPMHAGSGTISILRLSLGEQTRAPGALSTGPSGPRFRHPHTHNYANPVPASPRQKTPPENEYPSTGSWDHLMMFPCSLS